MKISQLIIQLVTLLVTHGDVKVYINDMKPINEGHLDLVEDDPKMQTEIYGDKYLHLGEW